MARGSSAMGSHGSAGGGAWLDAGSVENSGRDLLGSREARRGAPAADGKHSAAGGEGSGEEAAGDEVPGLREEL